MFEIFVLAAVISLVLAFALMPDRCGQILSDTFKQDSATTTNVPEDSLLRRHYLTQVKTAA